MASSDADLFVRARAGDVEARSLLFDSVHGPVLALVRQRLGPALRARLESEDVVQSALADALAGLERFDAQGEGAFHAWLATIVENKLRKAARAQRVGERDPARTVPFADGPIRSSPTPSGLVAGAEERARILALVERLPERERRLVSLRLVEQKPWDRVLAESGETGLKAARGAYARGVARLATWLEP